MCALEVRMQRMRPYQVQLEKLISTGVQTPFKSSIIRCLSSVWRYSTASCLCHRHYMLLFMAMGALFLLLVTLRRRYFPLPLAVSVQFELVNVSAVSESMPDTPPPQSPLAAFFQRSSFRGFRESPRPAAVTSPQPHSATRYAPYWTVSKTLATGLLFGV